MKIGHAMKRTLIALAGLCAGLSASAQPSDLPLLRMGYSSQWAPPWGELRNGQVVGGIHHDVGQLLAQRLGWRLRFSRIPQLQPSARLTAAHMQAHADLICGMHPSWAPDAQAFHWSDPLFETGDVLVGHAGTPAPASLAELAEGTRVGTVVRYRYPALESQFAKGQLLRDDAPDQGSALRKLRHQRTPVAVVSQQSLAWYLRQTPNAGLAPWRLTVHAAQYHCALPKGTKVDARAVTQALQALKREGALERVLARYAPS